MVIRIKHRIFEWKRFFHL